MVAQVSAPEPAMAELNDTAASGGLQQALSGSRSHTGSLNIAQCYVFEIWDQEMSGD